MLTHLAPASPRARSALALFGLSPADLISTLPDYAAVAADILSDRAPITLLSGPSGSGKSSTLRALIARARDQHPHIFNSAQRAASALSSSAPIVDLFISPPHGPHGSLRLLSLLGLADAHIPAQHPSTLSEGQRARLSLALAFDRALAAHHTHASPRAHSHSPILIIADEFASSLDRLTARSLCAAIHHWFASRAPAQLRIILASAHDDLIPWLAPDLHIRFSASGSVAKPSGTGVPPVSSSCSSGTGVPPVHPSPPPLLSITITPGTFADYQTLAPLHYRPARPATIAQILAARIPDLDTPVGVLVVSMPTLNARWRNLAWPNRYSSAGSPGSKALNAKRLNDDLRTISRVIVDPRLRNLSIATRLVRAYLNNPLTPNTEAVAAMGSVSPFFARAGMTEYPLAPSPRDARLLDALTERSTSIHDPALLSLLSTDPFLAAELVHWSRASRASTRAHHTPIELLHAARRSLSTTLTAYAHTKSTISPDPSLRLGI